MLFHEFSRGALITEKIAFSWPHLICRISFTTRCHGFPSLRFPWGHHGLFCKSPCDSFVLQNVGSAETPKSAFENALSVIFSFSFFYFLVRPWPTPFLYLHIFEMRFHWLSSTVIFWTLGLPGTIFFHSDFGSHFFYSGSFKCIHLNEKLLLYCTACCLSLGAIAHSIIVI